MQRFLCESCTEFHDGQEVILDREESRHALRVLRLRSGDTVGLINGRGWRATAALLNQDSTNSARVRVLQGEYIPPPPLQIHLVQAMLKNKAMDLVIQKAVEAGVDHLWPVITDHCEARVAVQSGDARQKIGKWQKVAAEACKQSGNPWMPVIHPVALLPEWLSRHVEGDEGFMLLTASLRPEPTPNLTAVSIGHNHVAVFIGPEGDFSNREYSLLEESGVVPVRLGQHTLRSETAAVVAVGCLRMMLDTEAGA
jgi:16S rRNA (uracil1498-N3)-methyltransferase